MTQGSGTLVAGTDAGAECVKVVVVDSMRRIRGRSVVPTRGYFQDCIQEAMSGALEEAKASAADLQAGWATGFGASCTPVPGPVASETACLARGAFHLFARPLTVVDIGGRAPKVIRVGPDGLAVSSRGVRKCAVGIGTFLMFTARHLDVHPTRLMDLAQGAKPARVGSYCSVLAEVEVIELLRQGVDAGEIALGAMHSVAERVLETGSLEGPVVVTGGVCEYFPGVVEALAARSTAEVEVAPEPILCGALGAALFAMDSLTEART